MASLKQGLSPSRWMTNGGVARNLLRRDQMWSLETLGNGVQSRTEHRYRVGGEARTEYLAEEISEN